MLLLIVKMNSDNRYHAAFHRDDIEMFTMSAKVEKMRVECEVAHTVAELSMCGRP